MTGHIPSAAVMDPFQFAPAEGELIFDIDSCFCIMCQLVMIVELKNIIGELQNIFVEAAAFCLPEVVPFHGFFIGNEKFHFHLSEFAGTECKHSGSDFVTECLPDLCDPEGKLFAGGDSDLMEIDEDRLAGFSTEISDMIIIGNRAHMCFHHEVEFAGFGQIFGSAVGAGGGIFHLVDAMTGFAIFAVAHDIAETVNVTGCFPDFGVADDCGIEPDDVIAFFDHEFPPGLFHGTFEHNSIRTVIPETVITAVNFRTLENEPAPFAQGNELFHQIAFDIDFHVVLSFVLVLNLE